MPRMRLMYFIATGIVSKRRPKFTGLRLPYQLWHSLDPVRIIQRFGRIDRIGSRNKQIQLVNYWPDMELDDYIQLKGRIESRMKATILTTSRYRQSAFYGRRSRFGISPWTTKEVTEWSGGYWRYGHRYQHHGFGIERVSAWPLAICQGTSDIEHALSIECGSRFRIGETGWCLCWRTATMPLILTVRINCIRSAYGLSGETIERLFATICTLNNNCSTSCVRSAKIKTITDRALCAAVNRETQDGRRMTSTNVAPNGYWQHRKH